MPNVTVDVKVRLVGPNEARYERRLLPVDAQREPADEKDPGEESKLYFVVPSRTSGPHPNNAQIYGSC